MPTTTSSSVLRPSSSPASVSELQKCSPCGPSTCTFTSTQNPSKTTYILVIGKPVSNCQTGNKQVVKTTYSSEMDIQESWSVDATLGISIPGLDIHAGADTNWSKSTIVKASQEVELNIIPGQKGALVANVSYTKLNGQMSVDAMSMHFSSLQPRNILSYDVRYAACGKDFTAFDLGVVDCTSAAVSTQNFNPVMAMFVVFLSIFWLLA